MPSLRRLACLGVALFAGACGADGRFLNNEAQTFTTLPPTAVVVLYSPTAEGERAPEPCVQAGGRGLLPFLADRGAVPPVILALAESGGDLLVYVDCSLARGHAGAAAFEAAAFVTVRPEPCFARGVEPASGYVELKACRRLEDLKRLVREVHRNLPAERIFVAGSGVGGWAALLAARDPFRRFNAAIALEPAITGPGVPRNETWAIAAERHRTWLAAGPPVPALVVTEAGATPESDALSATAIADLQVVPSQGDAAQQARVIRAYIECRLKNPASSCPVSESEG